EPREGKRDTGIQTGAAPAYRPWLTAGRKLSVGTLMADHASDRPGCAQSRARGCYIDARRGRDNFRPQGPERQLRCRYRAGHSGERSSFRASPGSRGGPDCLGTDQEGKRPFGRVVPRPRARPDIGPMGDPDGEAAPGTVAHAVERDVPERVLRR